MEHDFGSLIKALNEVNSNIWLGDLKGAIEIAESSLKKARKTEIVDPQETANKLRDILKEKRREAKQKNVNNRRLWVAEQVSKTVKQEEINPVMNLYGVLLRQLSDLRDAMTYLLELKSQTTLPFHEEKTSDAGFQLQKAEGYRYAIQRQPDKWDVRAILDKSPSKWDMKKLRELLSSYGFSVVELYTGKSSRTFELYSQDMYVQVLNQENQLAMSVFTVETSEARRRISRTLETILNLLVQ